MMYAYPQENEYIYVCMIFIFYLLGSEKVKASHSKGKQLVETNNINKSLLTLGNQNKTII